MLSNFLKQLTTIVFHKRMKRNGAFVQTIFCDGLIHIWSSTECLRQQEDVCNMLTILLVTDVFLIVVACVRTTVLVGYISK